MNINLLPICVDHSQKNLIQYTTKLLTKIRRIQTLSSALKMITKAAELPIEYRWQVLRSAPTAQGELIRVDDRLFLTQKNLKTDPQTLYNALETSHSAYPIREIQVEGREELFTFTTLMRICEAGIAPSDLLISKTIMFRDNLAWFGTLAELKLMLRNPNTVNLPEVNLCTFFSAWELIVREAILPPDEPNWLKLLELRSFLEDHCHNYETLPSFLTLGKTIEERQDVEIEVPKPADDLNWEHDVRRCLDLHSRFCPRLKWVRFITEDETYEYQHNLIKHAYSTPRLLITPVQCKLRIDQSPVTIEPDFFYNVITLFSQVESNWWISAGPIEILPYELDVDRETLDFARELYRDPMQIDNLSADQRLWHVYDFVRRHSLPPPGPYCRFTKKLNATFGGNEITLSWSEIVLNWENAHTIHMIDCDTTWTRRDLKAFLRHGLIKLSDLQTTYVCKLKGKTRTVSRARLKCLVPNEGYWPFLGQVDPDIFDLAWNWQFNGRHLPYATESERAAILEVHAFYRHFTTRTYLEEFEIDYLLHQINLELDTTRSPFLWLCTRLLGHISHPRLSQTIENRILYPSVNAVLGRYDPLSFLKALQCGYLIVHNPDELPFENLPLTWVQPYPHVVGMRIQDSTARQNIYMGSFNWNWAVPALQKLVFACFPSDFLDNLPHLPQLRSLRFRNPEINITDLELLFERMPNLEELEFYYDGSFTLQPLLLFPRLKDLHVNCISEAQLLDFPVLPNITSLTATVMTHLQPARFSSFPNLKKLSYAFDSMQLTPFFTPEALQKLESVEITQRGDAWAATRLVDDMSSTYRLPKLKTLKLTKIYLRDNVRLDLPSLTELAISYCDFLSPFHIKAPKLERLMAFGYNLNLSIRCGILTNHCISPEMLHQHCRSERLVMLSPLLTPVKSLNISNRPHLKHIEFRNFKFRNPVFLSNLPQLQSVHFHKASGNINVRYHKCPQITQSTYYPLRKRSFYWTSRICLGLFLIALANGKEFFPQHRRLIAIALAAHWAYGIICQRAIQAIGQAEYVTAHGIRFLQRVFIVAQCIGHLVILVLTSALLVKLPTPPPSKNWSWIRNSS